MPDYEPVNWMFHQVPSLRFQIADDVADFVRRVKQSDKPGDLLTVAACVARPDTACPVAVLRSMSSEEAHNPLVQPSDACAGRVAVFQRAHLQASSSNDVPQTILLRNDAGSFDLEAEFPIRERVTGFMEGGRSTAALFEC